MFTQRLWKAVTRLFMRAGRVCFCLALALSFFMPAAGMEPASASASLPITFEESIPAPDTVRSQYCNNPDTNLGVAFQNVRIVQPGIQTASPTHAGMEIPGDDDVAPHDVFVTMNFTTGQSMVQMKVGLTENVFPGSAMKAVLRAYDVRGAKITPDPDPSVALGAAPTPITRLLEYRTAGGAKTIRRVELEFMGVVDSGEDGIEVFDDLTFSDIGPTCVTDSTPPKVQIITPSAGQVLTGTELLEKWTAEDAETGIANVQVTMYSADGRVLQEGYYCGGHVFPSTCPPSPINAQYWSYLSRDMARMRVQAMDYAGNTGQAEVAFNLSLPEAAYNLWAMGIELTQGIQNQVPQSQTTRSAYAAHSVLSTIRIPLVARKRTVLRLYPGVEGASVPVMGVRATLYCFTALGQNLISGTRCQGPAAMQAEVPEITVDPANNNNLYFLRLNPAASWNFVLPVEWTEQQGTIWLVAVIDAPDNLPECGSLLSGCADGANFFLLEVPGFLETAPLVVQPRFACVRRTAGVPTTTCDTVASTTTYGDQVADMFLHGNDWNQDGLPDPFLAAALPIADGAQGIQIRPAVVGDALDANLTTGNVEYDQWVDYLEQICDAFHLDNPAPAPVNLRYLGFVPRPFHLVDGISYLGDPCSAATVTINNAYIGGVGASENDYCSNSSCGNNSRFVLHWDERIIAHELIHTFDVTHAGCNHGEEGGGGCDPAPDVFPCPDGGFCLDQNSLDEPYGFNTYNMSVLAPRQSPYVAHDLMSYGPAPKWISPYTYKQVFDKLRSYLTVDAPAGEAGPRAAEQPVLFVRGNITRTGAGVLSGSINSIYALQENAAPGAGAGAYSLEVQDATGQVLARRFFDPSQVSETTSSDKQYVFFERIAFPSQMAKLVLKSGSSVLAVRDRVSGAPSVNIVQPAAGASWPVTPGMVTIQWEPEYPPVIHITYLVQYSRDAGATWQTLATGLTGTSLAIAPNMLGGSNVGEARIRVIASYGLNFATAVSEGFTVAQKRPTADLISPLHQSSYPEGQYVDLMGAGVDTEDGPLPESAYQWTSSLDGILGTGSHLRLNHLSPGTHTIRLTVTDSSGRGDWRQVLVTIQDLPNHQPVADAGENFYVRLGANVQLNGLGSFDRDGDTLRYAWAVVSAPVSGSLLTGASSPAPRFTASAAGKYTFELSVRDGSAGSFPARVSVTAGMLVYLPNIRR